MHLKRILNFKRKPLTVCLGGECLRFQLAFYLGVFALRKDERAGGRDLCRGPCLQCPRATRGGCCPLSVPEGGGLSVCTLPPFLYRLSTKMSAIWHIIWSHKEIKLAHFAKLKCSVAIRIRNSTFRSHQMERHICRDPGKDHLSPSRRDTYGSRQMFLMEMAGLICTF